jgi:hypothetical protein
VESVIIVAERGFKLEELRDAIASRLRVADAAFGRIIIENGDQHVHRGRDDRIVAEMEPDELARLRSTMTEPVFFALDFSDIHLCKDLLTAIADRTDVLIDTDHGVVLSGADFVKVLRSKRDWDWRLDGPT